MAIDEGGLSIREVGGRAYYEVGGESATFQIWRVFKDSGADQLLEDSLTKTEALERGTGYDPKDGFIVVIDGEED